ncbi:ICP22 family protein [Actinophytocola sp. KF-1]
MEETDPARVLPAKKQVAEATTSNSGGAVPMVPPMGMPMSPHAPRTGDAAAQQRADQPLYTADMPAEGFGSPAVTLAHGQLLPAEPAIAARVAEPLAPLRPAEHVASDDVHILPVEDKPCTCCGTFHDGQEHRPFDDDVRTVGNRGPDTQDRPTTTADTQPTDTKPDDCCCHCCGDEHPGLDKAHGDGSAGTPTDTDEDSEEDTDETPDDDHPGGDSEDDSDDDHSGGDSENDPDDDHSGGDDSENDPDDDHSGGDDSENDSDDDCPADDEDSGNESGHSGGDDEDSGNQPGHGDADDEDSGDQSGGDEDSGDESGDGDADDEDSGDQSGGDEDSGDESGHGDADDEDSGDHPGGDEDSADEPGHGDADDSGDHPRQDEDWDKCGNGAHDKPGKGDDKPGHHDHASDRPGGDRPGGDRPGGDRPGGGPSGHEVGGKPVPHGSQDQPRTPTDSNYAVDGGKPATPPVPGERATMAPPTQGLTKPVQPATETGATLPGRTLGGQSTPSTSGGSPTTPAIPAVQKLATPLTPTTSFAPPTTNGQHGNGNGNSNGEGNGPGATGGSPQTFYKSEPPPGYQGNGNSDGTGSGGSPQTFYKSEPPPGHQGNGNGTPSQEVPRQAALQATMPATVSNPGANGGTNPLFPTGGTGAGGAFPGNNGNVGPDPNVKFDETAFNQLIAVVGGVRDTIGKATRNDITYLDSELLVQPNNQTWEPATKLVTRGGLFGGSVDTENTSLEKTLKTFHESLQLAKEVFKETDDLAAYDATRFTTAYPGFNSGGLPGGAF